VYRLVVGGRLHTVQVGRARRIPAAELERFVAQLRGEQGTAAEQRVENA
jgi:hypothetical protein